MKTNFVRRSFLGFVVIATAAACSTSKQSEPATSSTSTPTTREETALATVTATVEAIDVAKREVTLRGPQGNVVTFVVDERVERLAEIRVGDQVTADYYVALAAELRAPTEEERAAPLVVVDARARAPKGTRPAGGALRTLRVVATVVGLDRPTQSVLLTGPRGNALSVHAREKSNFEKLHIGDTIIVTYTEALAVSLKKVGSRGD
ncbi:MAG: hypothetical protein ACKVWV_12715 [Planctomycetota bacterium]